MDKPLPRKQRVLNRGYLYSRSGENIKNPEVTLIDIDSSILFYFENVIQPSIEENGENIKVPIMYASPERWSAIKNKGFLRDKKRQVITPVIVYRRTSVTKDAVPQDKQIIHIRFILFKRNFHKKINDVFTTNRVTTSEEYYNVMIDYVTISYDFIIWTSYIEQTNSIVENLYIQMVNKDPEKMRFRSSIDFED